MEKMSDVYKRQHKKILKQQQAALDDVVAARQKGRKWIDDLKQEYMES